MFETVLATHEGVPILYEDNHLLIVVKPPNMPAQSDPTGDLDVLTAMKAYIQQKYRKPGEAYMGLVHRLDRPVGGLMVLARTGKAAARLSEQVRDKTMGRAYVALVRGEAPDAAQLTDWLLKNPRTNMVRVVPEGTRNAKLAVLDYRRLGYAEGLSLVEVRLHTGRSHQIRVQLSHAGLPLWGDARYGGGRPGQQIALWGAKLSLQHPTQSVQLSARALPPQADFPWSLFSWEDI